MDDRFPYWVYAGQQDSSTIRVPSLPPYSHPLGAIGFWQSVGGCETGPAVPKPGDADIVYANCKGRFGRFNLRTGQEKRYYVGAANMYGHHPKDLEYRFQRVSPIHVSPHDPGIVYHASQYLHRTPRRRRHLGDDLSRPHGQRSRDAGHFRSADHSRHHRRGVLQHDLRGARIALSERGSSGSAPMTVRFTSPETTARAGRR